MTFSESHPQAGAENTKENFYLNPEIQDAFRQSECLPALSSICRELQERQDQDLNELIEPQEFSQLEAATAGLKDLLTETNFAKPALMEILHTIKGKLDALLQVPPARRVRDDDDSLNRLADALEHLHGESEVIGKKIADQVGFSGEMVAPDLHQTLEELRPILEEKIEVIRRRAQALAGIRY